MAAKPYQPFLNIFSYPNYHFPLFYFSQNNSYIPRIKYLAKDLTKTTCFNIIIWHETMYIEAWLSLVERCVRDAEAAGSNPVASTKKLITDNISVMSFFIFLDYVHYKCYNGRK